MTATWSIAPSTAIASPLTISSPWVKTLGEGQSGVCRFIADVFERGDRVSVRDLSRGLIVDSGNDACVALADYIAGGQPQFVEMMNNYAEKLHLKDTHFETVHGLDAPGPA